MGDAFVTGNGYQQVGLIIFVVLVGTIPVLLVAKIVVDWLSRRSRRYRR